MDHLLIERIDRKIEELREEIAALTIRLVNIKSVQEEPLPGAPFGMGPKRVLDEAIKIGTEAGFSCTEYGSGVISLALEPGHPDLGIWVHGDVVPEGAGWKFDPYNAVEYKGCVIGRGATDNKGQLAALFLLLRAFKELGISLKYNPALYIGSNEESGMGDLVGVPGNPYAEGFLNIATPPRMSLVPDSGFPVGYGGKGSLTLKLKSKTPLHGYTVTAGQPSDPGLVTATFETAPSVALPGCQIEENRATVWTPPQHDAHPRREGNMITVFSKAMLESGICPEEDRYIWEFFHSISSDIDGVTLGIQSVAEGMHPLTVFSKMINTEDGYPILTLNIRYPDSIMHEEIRERVASEANKKDFELVSFVPRSPAYRVPADTPVVKMLCDAANSVTGKDAPPYTLNGGTYACRLPNAYVFGSNGCLPPSDFPKGKGSAHGVDEAVSLDRLQRAMRIYARALLGLNELEW